MAQTQVIIESVSPAAPSAAPPRGEFPLEPAGIWALVAASGIHHRGVFARCAIPAGTVILEYVGERISKAESLRRCEANNAYIFELNEREDVDGNVPWNPARFINHSCRPNCEAQLEGDRIPIVALREIAAGEELTFNYGYDLVDYHEHPCRCGAPDCVGFIVAEEFFPEVRRRSQVSGAAAVSGG